MNRSASGDVCTDVIINRIRVSAALVAVFSAVGLSTTAPVPASATTPTEHVSIQMFSFTPTAIGAPMGSTVVWRNLDSVAHTTTSDQGFWGSPHLGTGISWSRRFNQAGTFGYHCAIHTDMRGRVGVPMRVSARTGGGFLVWSLARGRFDVQEQRPGSTVWVTYRSSTTALTATFTTRRLGRYRFRARTHSASGVSGWSPAVTLTVR